MSETNTTKSEKVVIQFGTKTIKGYLESPAWKTIEELLSNAPRNFPETVRIRILKSGTVEEVSIADIKAIFYVNSFEGDSTHRDLQFHSCAPIVYEIWMLVQFLDGEIIEGIVFNSLRYLVDPGFFLVPTDPGSNNKLVYVVKDRLMNHRILGIRKLESVDVDPARIE